MTLNNEKTKKIIYFLSVLILSAVAIIPYLVFMGIIFTFEPDYKGEEFILTIFINSFAFQIFYFFCYSMIFNLYPLNKKVILLSFLSFLLIFLIWHSLNYLMPIGFLYSTNEELNIPFFQMHIITNIFSFVIFFILTCLSYNKFIINDIKNINKFFTLTGNTIIFSLIIYFILIIIWILYILLFSIIMIKIFDFELNGNLEMFLFFKIPIIIFIFLCGVAPFISYILFSTFKKLENISIYFARGIILIFLFLEFTALLGLFSPLLRPYENKFIFIIYNILLALIAATLFFISPNYKAGVFVKAIYLITPIFSALFNLVVLSATIFRIIEYGITATKIILLLTNFSILLHLIIISVCNIKSIIKSLKSENIEIGDDKTVFYIYVYGALAFVVCFIIPIVFKVD